VNVHPALERQGALGVPGYSQSRLTALKSGWIQFHIFPRFQPTMFQSRLWRDG